MKKPFYPILLAAFPVLLMLASNITQVWSVRGLRPVLVAAALSGLLMMLLWASLADTWDQAAWGTVLVFSILNYQIMLVLTLIGAIDLIFSKRSLEQKNIYFNTVAIILVLIPLVLIGVLAGPRDWPRVRAAAAAGQVSTSRPDIYFIILDSYTGHETLLQRFGYDNTSFLETLKADGFQTGDCTSSYNNTAPSLASTLNFGKFDPDPAQIWKAIRNSQVRQVLEAKGYRTVAFEDGFDWSELMDASTYIHTPIFGRLTDFESYYLRQTLLGKFPAIQQALQASWAENYRLRIQNTLVNLPNVASLPSPKLVFVHLIMPHPPFIYHADGSPSDDTSLRNPHFISLSDENTAPEYTLPNYAIGYVEQVAYIDSVIPGVLKRVIENSSTDPVIILQGDHGPRYSQGDDQFSILCAVHAPARLNVPLEPEHTFDFVVEER